MKRTIIFVAIVTLVSGMTSFVLAGLTAGSGREPNTPFVAMALDMAAGETAVLRIKAGLGGIKLAPETDSAELRRSLAKVPMVETAMAA